MDRTIQPHHGLYDVEVPTVPDRHDVSTLPDDGDGRPRQHHDDRPRVDVGLAHADRRTARRLECRLFLLRTRKPSLDPAVGRRARLVFEGRRARQHEPRHARLAGARAAPAGPPPGLNGRTTAKPRPPGPPPIAPSPTPPTTGSPIYHTVRLEGA